MIRAINGFAAALIILSQVSCGQKPKPLPINHSEIVYDLAKIMVENELDGIYRGRFTGQRCYKNAAGQWPQHEFLFDSDDDYLVLTMTDNDGK